MNSEMRRGCAAEGALTRACPTARSAAPCACPADGNCALSDTAKNRECSACNPCPRQKVTETEFDRNFALAMSYVPWQEFREILPSCNALKHGTIFAQLIKPLGRGRGGAV